VVLNYGYEAELDPFNPVPSALPQTDLGDLTRVYEATPFAYGWMPCVVEFSGNVVDEALDPVDGAEVFINGDWAATTDVSGFYSFEWGSDDGGVDFTLEVDKSGYWSEPAELKGVKCDDQVVNFQVITCDEIWVKGHVFDNETGLPIEGAFVTAINDSGSADGLTDADGKYEVGPLPYDDADATWVFAKADGYNTMADSEWIPCGDWGGMDFQLHTTPMSRILLYYGNMGDDDGTGFNSAEALFQYMGYFVDYTNDWPTDPDLEEYKVIFLLGPGNTNNPQDHPDTFFTPGQVAQMDLFLRNGGRLVVMGEADHGMTTENTLIGQLNDLDIAIENDVTNWGNIHNNALADQITADQLTFGVATLDFDTATDVAVFAGAAPGLLAGLPAAHTSGALDMLAADTMPGITRLSGPGFAGDVVIVGDLDWMDDGSFMGDVTYDPITGDPSYVWPDWPADNENLLLNIFTF
jgi:hypothetical protein